MKNQWTPKKILNLRRRLHYTQRDLADYLEVDPTSISRYERGRSRPDQRAQKALTRLNNEHPA